MELLALNLPIPYACTILPHCLRRVMTVVDSYIEIWCQHQIFLPSPNLVLGPNLVLTSVWYYYYFNIYREKTKRQISRRSFFFEVRTLNLSAPDPKLCSKLLCLCVCLSVRAYDLCLIMAMYEGRRLRVVTKEGGYVFEGTVHSIDLNNSKISLMKGILIKNGYFWHTHLSTQ